MTAAEIRRRRLQCQRLGVNLLDTSTNVVRWLIASQAQDYLGAKWALGLRFRDARDTETEDAFNSGAILRTHMLRPTWHFVTPDDIGWVLSLTGPRVHQLNASQYRALEIDHDGRKHCHRALTLALRDRNFMTRSQLRDVLSAAGLNVTDGRRLAYFLMSAELDRLICSGPRRGKQFTYALFDERAPGARLLPRDEALSELAQRYFRSRGPATVHDFAKWSGLTVADARRGLEAVPGELETESYEGTKYHFASSSDTTSRTGPRAQLLSIYDEFVSSYRNHSASISAEFGQALVAKDNALLYVILVNGQIVGTWRRTIERARVDLQIEPFRDLTNAEARALESAARRYGEYFELPVDSTIRQ